MSIFRCLAATFLAATCAASLNAEQRCPGSVASLRYSSVHGHQMMVAVSVNRTGPFTFLFDTGSQLSILDPALAAELHLQSEGAAAFVGFGDRPGTFAQTEIVGAGSIAVTGLKVLVSDLGFLRAGGVEVRGILGEDFLQHFDLLIDNTHKLICLDDSGTLRESVRDPRIPLQPFAAAPHAALPDLLIVSARLADGLRPLRLALDSGATVPVLYNASAYLSLEAIAPSTSYPNHRSTAYDGRRHYAMLAPQEMRIGAAKLPQVSFASIVGSGKFPQEFDGDLPLDLFRRVLIDQHDRSIVLEPW
jgi:Aspartyl protease